jgi:undecaprenyl-diphosphatase
MFEIAFNNIILGLVQGLTEFIPVSSSGHLIIFRDILGLQVNYGLAYDAILQLATTLAILVYFRKDLVKILFDFKKFVLKKSLEKSEKRMVQAIIFGTIPAVILGLLLENFMETVFRNSLLVALSLIVGSLVMIVAENYYIKLKTVRKINKKRGLFIGLFQSLALIPGMSRSGMTIAGGLFNKLDREEATKFSFLLATPILLGSGLKQFLDLSMEGTFGVIGFEILIGFVVAFVTGFFAIRFLIKFLKNNSLRIFAYYRIVLAAMIIAIYLVY